MKLLQSKQVIRENELQLKKRTLPFGVFYSLNITESYSGYFENMDKNCICFESHVSSSRKVEDAML